VPLAVPETNAALPVTPAVPDQLPPEAVTPTLGVMLKKGPPIGRLMVALPSPVAASARCLEILPR
jgi:hypothetical protein